MCPGQISCRNKTGGGWQQSLLLQHSCARSAARRPGREVSGRNIREGGQRVRLGRVAKEGGQRGRPLEERSGREVKEGGQGGRLRWPRRKVAGLHFHRLCPVNADYQSGTHSCLFRTPKRVSVKDMQTAHAPVTRECSSRWHPLPLQRPSPLLSN